MLKSLPKELLRRVAEKDIVIVGGLIFSANIVDTAEAGSAVSMRQAVTQKDEVTERGRDVLQDVCKLPLCLSCSERNDMILKDEISTASYMISLGLPETLY